jgi:hypothetical protein
MRRRASVAFGLVILGAAMTLSALEGCEAIVGGTLGNVPCVDVPGACPTGQSCMGGVCTACTGSGCHMDASFDVHVLGDEDSAPPTDVRAENVGQDVHDAVAMHDAEASSPKPLGAACTTASDCESGVCGNSILLVGVPITGSICTEPCCTSTDCVDTRSPGFICYPSVGGNYCINPTLLGLPTAGAVAAGGPCTTGSDCRSSVCDTSTDKCDDVCCTGSDCGGTTCQFSSFDQGENYNCGPSGGSEGTGGDCSIFGCESNLCITAPSEDEDPYCYGPCCSNMDCGFDGNDQQTSCNWMQIEDDGGLEWTRSCTETPNPGKATFGMHCTAAGDCASGLCNTTAGLCTMPCCGTDAGADSECGTDVCGYAQFALGGGTVDLQVCVPR